MWKNNIKTSCLVYGDRSTILRPLPPPERWCQHGICPVPHIKAFTARPLPYAMFAASTTKGLLLYRLAHVADAKAKLIPSTFQVNAALYVYASTSAVLGLGSSGDYSLANSHLLAISSWRNTSSWGSIHGLWGALSGVGLAPKAPSSRGLPPYIGTIKIR